MRGGCSTLVAAAGSLASPFDVLALHATHPILSPPHQFMGTALRLSVLSTPIVSAAICDWHRHRRHFSTAEPVFGEDDPTGASVDDAPRRSERCSFCTSPTLSDYVNPVNHVNLRGKLSVMDCD